MVLFFFSAQCLWLPLKNNVTFPGEGETFEITVNLEHTGKKTWPDSTETNLKTKAPLFQ